MKISLGTKNSVVDVARSQAVAATIREMGHDVDVVHIPAASDSETVEQLRLGLMRGDFDLVVHRMHRIPKQQMPAEISHEIIGVSLRVSKDKIGFWIKRLNQNSISKPAKSVFIDD